MAEAGLEVRLEGRSRGFPHKAITKKELADRSVDIPLAGRFGDVHAHMSHRLQVLIPEELESRLRKAAQRGGVSKGEFVRRAIEGALRGSSGKRRRAVDPLDRLASLNAPTADIDQMVREIEAGRDEGLH